MASHTSFFLQNEGLELRLRAPSWPKLLGRQASDVIGGGTAGARAFEGRLKVEDAWTCERRMFELDPRSNMRSLRRPKPPPAVGQSTAGLGASISSRRLRASLNLRASSSMGSTRPSEARTESSVMAMAHATASVCV